MNQHLLLHTYIIVYSSPMHCLNCLEWWLRQQYVAESCRTIDIKEILYTGWTSFAQNVNSLSRASIVHGTGTIYKGERNRTVEFCAWLRNLTTPYVIPLSVLILPTSTSDVCHPTTKEHNKNGSDLVILPRSQQPQHGLIFINRLL